MARQDILLVGTDYNSLRILEVSLRKAGFMVVSVFRYSDALEELKISLPDLVIIDSINDAESFDFAVKLKGEYRALPVILISSNKEINTRIRALEIGIDDYLIKPIYIKEVIARTKIHLQKRERERIEEGITAGFIGSLADIGLFDIIQTIELNKKSGILEIKGKTQEGRIYFKNGQIVQANLGKVKGENAVYKMLALNEGVFKMSFLDIDIEQEITKPNNALIMEGMRRLDEYMKYTEQLPPLTTRLDIDEEVLRQRLKDIPDNVNRVLKLVDSERSINDILEASELDELETLKIISALYFDGIVYDVFQKKGAVEKKGESTLPKPINESQELSGVVERQNISPQPSDGRWAESVFVKEEEMHERLISEPSVGDMTISVSDRPGAEEKKEGAYGEKKAPVVVDTATPQQVEPVRAPETEKSSNLQKESIPETSPQQTVSNIISADSEDKSGKERIIENTLIENITLSTSSYVKGTLLGEKGKKPVRTEEKRSYGILILVVVIAILGAGGYFAYKQFLRSRRGELIRLSQVISSPSAGQQDVTKSVKQESPPAVKEVREPEKQEETQKQEVRAEEREVKEERVTERADKPLKEAKVEEVEERRAVAEKRDEMVRNTQQKESAPVVDMEGYKASLESAKALYKAGNLNGAKEELKQSLIKNPKGFEAFTLLGQIDLEANKIKSAITYLKRAISYNSKYAPAYFYLGTCYQLNGDIPNAKKMYEKYLSLAPNGEFAGDVKAIMSDLK